LIPNWFLASISLNWPCLELSKNSTCQKNQIGTNSKHSILVILCSGWLYAKLTFWWLHFLVSGLFVGWPFILVCRCLLLWNYYVSCLWAPLLVMTQKKGKVYISNLCFFDNKNNNLTIWIIVKYYKMTLYVDFLVFLGPIFIMFFSCWNDWKK
jgi:hypothetical protein